MMNIFSYGSTFLFAVGFIAFLAPTTLVKDEELNPLAVMVAGLVLVFIGGIGMSVFS